MSNYLAKSLIIAGAAAGLTFAFAASASAQGRPGQCKPTPPSFNWDYDRNCNRVPKEPAARKDGDRQEVRRGPCVEIKESSENAKRIERRCD